MSNQLVAHGSCGSAANQRLISLHNGLDHPSLVRPVSCPLIASWRPAP
jgi:hypothetical protein